MGRTTYNDGLPGFIADWNSISRNTGRQIDWEDDRVVDAEVTSIPAGTIMAEVDNNKVIPRSLVGAEDDETATCILLTAANKAEGIGSGNAAYGCLVGGVMYLNLLPDADHVDLMSWLNELGPAGTGFAWETYQDAQT